MASNVLRRENVKLEDLNDGVSRRVLSYSDNIMMVEVHFEKGSVGDLHTHFHEQCTYVIEGEFEFTIAGKKEIVQKGDSIYFEPNVEHGTVCLKAGVIIDVFTPKRDDFLK